MLRLAIDIETFSSVDLGSQGRHKYVASNDFEILLFGYAYNDEVVKVIDLTEEKIPDQILKDLVDPTVLKTAYNAAFERGCINKFFGLNSPADQWSCTMIKAALCSLPLKLDHCAAALKVVNQKDKAGRALIKYFTMPCDPTKANGFRTRNMPWDNRDKWEAFKNYNAQDVRTELDIRKAISFYGVPPTEKKLWVIDQKINDFGLRADVHFVNAAMEIDAITRNKLIKEAMDLTGLDNPNSVKQLKGWLEEEAGIILPNITKETIKELIKGGSRVAQIRQEISRSSIKKYKAIISCMGEGERCRGLFQLGGASRTNRWAGRLAQPQNLPKNKIEDLDTARGMVKTLHWDWVEICYGSVSDILSQLIRTAFIPTRGNKFITSDFSAIEARVISWYANEKWRMEVFKTHGKIYEAAGAAMFKVPIEAVTKTSDYRARAKIAELALGFNGGVKALERMGGASMGLSVDEMEEIVHLWRAANQRIVQLWYDVQNAIIHTLSTGESVAIGRLKFFYSHKVLSIQLPSKRKLIYLNPKLVEGKYGQAITYEGQNQTTGKWEVIDSYGGKFVENIVQATARDLLAEKIILIDQAGFDIVLHAHDEIVVDCPVTVDKEVINELMKAPVDWANDFPLGADTTEGFYYKKIKTIL